ncbi:MAG TPA: hypothetical protein ENK82_02580 [Campylobacterales bacterium]|nr:hypothetical protein [Campylobacterales bacterium]HHS92210.1 hypothetical protein [Campylobacterales bacterium]
MKNTMTLLTTLTFPFLLVNCSTQPSTITVPQINYPQPPIKTEPLQQTPQSNPILGRTISLPPQIIKERATPTFPHIKSNGKSFVSKKFKLPSTINETSGLIKIDNQLWTHNDSGGASKLYQIDEHNGRVLRSIQIDNASNRDWEDIAYDDTYVYIGDTGNNLGNRKDLKIYKIPRAALRNEKRVPAEVIHYSYNDQKSFKRKLHKHNFDCEAMIAHNGKLYLFSKNWQDYKTRLYELSTLPGRHKAIPIATFNINGLVTAADYNPELGILLLTTYNNLMNVNIWAFSNHDNRNFFSGQSKQLNIEPLQGQVEGVTFIDNYRAYLSSEAFRKYIFAFDAALYEVNFSGEFE